MSDSGMSDRMEIVFAKRPRALGWTWFNPEAREACMSYVFLLAVPRPRRAERAGPRGGLSDHYSSTELIVETA